MSKSAVMLRAVNVGGRRLTMAEFRAALAALGHPGAVTLAAAGNAVVDGRADEAKLEAGLAKALGAVTDVFVRGHAELAAVVQANPFAAMARADPGHLHVLFLRGDPAAGDVAALQAKIVGRETVAAGPGCLYACYPDGAGRSKLTIAVIERALKLRGTARNWNTVTKLASLTAEQ